MDTSGPSVVPMVLIVLCGVAIIAFEIAAWWKMFTKAGQPGWACLIPFYNVYVILQMASRPGWWLLLMLIPFVNLIVAIIVFIDVAKAFGKGTGFGLGLALLGAIFIPILGYGSAEYRPVKA